MTGTTQPPRRPPEEDPRDGVIPPPDKDAQQ